MRVSPSKSTARKMCPVARGSSALLEAPSGRTRVLTCIRLCTETPRAGAHNVFEEGDEKFIQLAHETKCTFLPKPEAPGPRWIDIPGTSPCCGRPHKVEAKPRHES